MHANRPYQFRRIVILFALISLVLGFIAFVLLYENKKPNRENNNAGNDEASADNAVSTELESMKKQKRRFPKIDKRTRTIMLQKILTAIQEKRKIGTIAHTEKQRTTDDLPKSYIGKKIIELTPLLKECYVTEMEERGQVSGKVVVEVSLVGDEEYGGLVEEVRILESQFSRERSDSFLECLRESLYAIQLDAPEWGGRQTVSYPFYFSSIGF